VNKALLTELQHQRGYPCITVLINTTPGEALTTNEVDTAFRFAGEADTRLDGDVNDGLRSELISRLTDLIAAQTNQRAARSLALCVSPDYTAAVRLGRPVDQRLIIDDTFATRDLVADLNRTAHYRVITVSERTTRLLIGDRQRLVEQLDDTWPLTRGADESPTAWARNVARHLRDEHRHHPLPTVVAGVQRSVRQVVTPELFETIGFIPGNHDRSSWMELHTAAWPLVTDWLRDDHHRAMTRLDQAMSNNRYAAGIDEIWPLANEGRIDTLIVEEDYAMAARIDHNNQLHPADDPHHPEVNDDIIDDTIEAVLLRGGSTVIAGPAALERHQRIAAILRY
jgi:hypothetical protein